MKTVAKTAEKAGRLYLPGLVWLVLLFSCSTVKEQGEPDVNNPAVITNDVQRRIIYERGADNVSPQNANPIPPSEQLGLDEQSSETNRKKNIEEGNNPNDPANTPNEQRPREIRNVGNDTIVR
jgi:hypothetical protein